MLAALGPVREQYESRSSWDHTPVPARTALVAPLGHNSTPGGPGDAARARLPWTTNTNTAFPCTPGAGSLCPLPGEPPWARRPAVPPSPRGCTVPWPGTLAGEGRGGLAPGGLVSRGASVPGTWGRGGTVRRSVSPPGPGPPLPAPGGQLPSRTHSQYRTGPPPLGAGQEGPARDRGCTASRSAPLPLGRLRGQPAIPATGPGPTTLVSPGGRAGGTHQ